MAACFTTIALAAVVKINSIKKTFIRGIYYTPATNSLDFWLYSSMGSKWIKDIRPEQISIVETAAGNNRIDKQFVVKDIDKFEGYKSFGYPGKSSWQGHEVFKAWYNKL